MTLSCGQMQQRIFALVAEQGTPDRETQAHLETCPSCRLALDQVQEISRQVRAIRVSTSPALAARTQALLRLRAAELRRKRQLYALVGGISLLYCIASLVTFRLFWRLAGLFHSAWILSDLARFVIVTGVTLLPIAILMVVLVFMESAGSPAAGLFLPEDTYYV